jgi:nucleotide-binding universal stress UspA family protein
MKILLPIDGSDCSNETLTWAAETFDKRDTVYHLLFVIPVQLEQTAVDFDVVEATAMLRRSKLLMETKGCYIERAEYVLGDVVTQICEYADNMGVDQIILGSHGRTGLSKLLMGSTSIKVMEKSHCPVTVHRNVIPASVQNH